MDNYRIIDMSNEKYDAAGIKLSSGKNCIYFKNKDKDYDKVIIGRDYNVDINDDEVALVFKKDDTKEDIVNLTTIFITALSIDVNKISFGCNVSNEKEEEEMLEISNMLGINFFVNRSKTYNQFLMQKEEAMKREEDAKKLEEERIKNQNLNSLDLIDEDANEVVVEKQADEFFNIEDDIPLKNESNKESLSDVFIQDWEQTKEESLFFQKDIEPKIYEKPVKKKKKSKIIVFLIIISVLLLVGALVLFLIK